MNHMPKPNVLIVDDEPENIRILAKALKERYTPMAATGGAEALEYVMSETNRPDIILMDIMMPDMNGYEVCSRLKANRATRDIPVIFITALSEVENEARGFEVGAVDYITKPFHPDIAEARVRTHLELRQYRCRLEELAEQRARQIVHMERLSMTGTLAAGFVHELGNFLNPVYSALYFIQNDTDSLLPFLMSRLGEQTEDGQKCLSLLGNIQKRLSDIKKSFSKACEIITSVKNFCSRDDSVSYSVSVDQCIEEALKLSYNALKCHVTVLKTVEPELPPVFGSSLQMEQVFVNLFSNAADAIRSVQTGTLEISAARHDCGIRIIVEDTGPGIPEDRLETVWEPFFTTKDAGKGTGLGLFICREIVRKHHGTIRAENRNEGGARFVIDLPVIQ